MIKSMDLSWITASDVEKAKEFFVHQLGLKLIEEAKEFGWLELRGHEGGMCLGVGKESPEEEHKAGDNAVIAMTVDDLVKTKEVLEKKGVEFLSDIVEIPGHVKLALFQDPDGNKFQLVEQVDQK